ncbi:ABC transporter permease [Paenibacillus baekrokdamisoli]|uniref:ABC transporter permease n=1 Tax=Paenibacillus baekrokdamisoli TaxID=1712516 RepID=A0A3G9J1Q8_9BACL|nr:ABC transporter permease [Paenibacillus baekrokdamisoli]MBB3071477.1 simple sugar transport system permease protein [Paenibacillus baekrokdamisoli]BBH24492.1 ABC transporter permease [Paenibacillus baekrokdamisoli]
MKRLALNKMEIYLLIIILAYSTVVTLVNPAFLSLETLMDMLRASSGMMILALGVLVVLISRGIDVSFTAVAIIGGYTAARAMLATGIDNLLFAFAVSGIIGLLLGTINALIIHCFKLPALIVTLGTSSVFYGLMTTFLGTKSITPSQMPVSLMKFGSSRLLEFTTSTNTVYGLSVFIIPVIVVIVATWFLLYKTMIGRGIFAMGNSEEAAVRAGFNLFVLRLVIYSFVGVLAGIMGVIYVSEVKMVNPVSLVGTELSIIAAAVIGGAKLTGGQGKIFGTLLGVTIIQLLNSTLVFLKLSTSWNSLFIGIVLVTSVAITSYQERIKNEKNLIFSS